jgi:hypothetical protein
VLGARVSDLKRFTTRDRNNETCDVGAPQCVLLASGYAIERLAMFAEATHLIERETTLRLLVKSYRLKHRAVRVLINARW